MGCEYASEDGRDHKGEHLWQEVDAALDGRVALDSLEPDGKIVDWRQSISKQ